MNQVNLFDLQYEDLSAQPNKSPSLNPQYPPYDMNRLYPNFPEQMDGNDFLKRRKFSLADMISVIKSDPKNELNLQGDHNQIGINNLYSQNVNNFDQMLYHQQSPSMMPQHFPIPQNFSLNQTMDNNNMHNFMLNQPETHLKLQENKMQGQVMGNAVDINGTQININLAAANLEQPEQKPEKKKKQRKTKAEKLQEQQQLQNLQEKQEEGTEAVTPAPKKKKTKKQKEQENAQNNANNNIPIEKQEDFQSNNSTDISQDKEKKQKNANNNNKENNNQNSNNNNSNNNNQPSNSQKKGTDEENVINSNQIKIENEDENINLKNENNGGDNDNNNESGQNDDQNDPNNENDGKKNGNKRIYIKRTTEKVRRWTKEESLLYEKFIEMYLDIMRDSSSKRNKKIFLLMSKFIGTKTPSQCRSHHQKFFKKIIKALTRDPNAEPKPLAEMPDIAGVLEELEKGKKKRQNKKKNKENEDLNGRMLEEGQIKIEPHMDEQNLMNNIAPLSAFNINNQYLENIGQNIFQNQYGMNPNMSMGMLGQPSYDSFMSMQQGQFKLAPDQYQYPFGMPQSQNAFQNQLQAQIESVQQAVRKRSYSFVNIKDHMGQEDNDDFDWKVMQKHQDNINWSKMFQNYQVNNSVDDYLKNLMVAHMDYFPNPGQYQHQSHDASQHGM